MEQVKKAGMYKYMFLISTVTGALGAYFLYKRAVVLGWVLICVWGIVATVVRVLIIKDKKLIKNQKI
jgi:hypothetical protein